MSEWIALGSLAVAAIALVGNFLRRNKQDAARDQLIVDKLDNQSTLVRDVKTTVDKLDGKMDSHAERIARIESEQDNIYRRLDRIEGRCERHFGPSAHD